MEIGKNNAQPPSVEGSDGVPPSGVPRGVPPAAADVPPSVPPSGISSSYKAA